VSTDKRADADAREPGAVLDALLAGELDRGQALRALAQAQTETQDQAHTIEDLGFARIDHDRAIRRGFPEVIYGPGKTAAQVGEIFTRLAARNPNVLCTRTDAAALAETRTRLGAALGPEVLAQLELEPRSGLLSLWREREPKRPGTIVVISAGTADEPVATEASLCAAVMGNRVEHLADVGVAGLHRVLAVRPNLSRARVIICVAGFEAALPSVIAGLVDCPVIAVPTSTGYGACFEGVSALLSCLTSCAAGVTTVNIDNGFGAAYAASLMMRIGERAPC